jgi:hypothetical protein
MTKLSPGLLTRRPLVEEVELISCLAPLITHWGYPEARWVFEHPTGLPTLDVFLFRGDQESKVHRFVTFGASYLCRAAGKAPVELFFVLPRDLGGAAEGKVRDYLVDVAVNVRNAGVVFEAGAVFDEGPLAPPEWGARALVVDSPTGEPECLERFPAHDGEVPLLWLVPVYGAEVALIRAGGLSAWEEVWTARDESVVDPRRPSFVRPTT